MAKYRFEILAVLTAILIVAWLAGMIHPAAIPMIGLWSSGGGGSSRPATGDERRDVFDKGLAGFKQYLGDARSTNVLQGKTGGYEAPAYVETKPMQLLGGDYNRLEQNILEGKTAPLKQLLNYELENLDTDLQKRGLYNSPGLAAEARGRAIERFAPQFAAVGADATSQRYGLQANEMNALNQWILQNNQGKNTFQMENASRRYGDQWQGLNYLKDLYNSTGGNFSTSEGGWSIL